MLIGFKDHKRQQIKTKITNGTHQASKSKKQATTGVDCTVKIQDTIHQC